MHPIHVVRLVALGSLLVTAIPLSAQDAADRPVLSREQQEEFLRTAEIRDVRDIPVGVTEPKRATLTDGTFSHDAQLQDVDIFDREFTPARGRTQINFRDSYKYNIAGYLMDKHFELNMVPVSVEREIDGRPNAVTWWVDDAAMTEAERLERGLEPPDARIWTYQIHVARVFNQLIDNTDINTGNLVITTDWQVWMIDFTRAFRTFKELRWEGDLAYCDRSLLEKLRTLDEALLTELLGEYLTEDEIAGVAARATLIVERFDELIAENGRGAVLFSLPPR